MLINRQLPSTSSKQQQKKKCSPIKNILPDPNTSISSVSIEAPKGCLRFFSKNPNLLNPRFKSAPNSKSFSKSINPPKENVSKNCIGMGRKPEKNPLCLSKSGSGRAPSRCSTKVQKEKERNESGEPSKIFKKPESGSDRNGKLASGSMLEIKLDTPKSKFASSKFLKENPKQKKVNEDELDTEYVAKSTPINKLDKNEISIATSSNNTTTTPPVQASMSPEINCASASSILAVSAAKTPACYGAGHIISGVADRRKCRARGILTVGQKENIFTNLNIVENGDDFGEIRKSRNSLVPFPVEASMQWILSPCEEMDENERTNERSGHKNSSDLCNISYSDCGFSACSVRKSKIILLSPSRSPRVEGISGTLSEKVEHFPTSASPKCYLRKNRYDMTNENSPFSSGSLGSGNVIRTPQSESSSDRHVGMSCLNSIEKKKYDKYDIVCVTENLLRASLSPKINRPIWDSADFNFNLPEFVSPSDSVDLSQLSNNWINSSSFVSNSKSNEMSASHMRVSWRDGLPNRIIDMDESDFCRCLSDDEIDAKKRSNEKIKSNLSHEIEDDMGDCGNCENKIMSLEIGGHAPEYEGYEGEREDALDMKRSNPCEESICIDGDGLAASGDSDWTLCYKNQLFEL